MHWEAFVCNAAWLAAQAPAAWRFAEALQNPAGAQAAILLRILRQNRDCAYGRKQAFSGISSPREFQERVPLTSYDDYEPWLARVRAGEPGVLTAAPVSRLVPSSGSSGAAKLIPYTPVLHREFGAAIAPWIYDLFRAEPALMRGPAFWSITPNFHSPVTDSRIPVGFDEDTEYLGRFWKPLVDATMAVPASVSRISDGNAFRDATLLHLLRCPELRLVSVWHPSFLTLLLDHLREHWNELVPKVEDSRRRALLRERGPNDLAAIWPKLKLISCWADGPAALPARQLLNLFPHVTIQPKGLLATEAFVTIPFRGAHPLAIRSHFFEVLDGNGRALLAEEVSMDGEYSVVVTTGGGLYRYRLQDRVRVVGRIGRTPSLEFIGREGGVVDLFGEKLNERFVASVLKTVFDKHAFDAKFVMVIPGTTGGVGQYVVLLESAGPCPEGLARELEREFETNPYYAQCVFLGQLKPARVEQLKPGAFERFLAWGSEKGTRMGNVKPRVLSGEPGLADVLRGRDVPPPGQTP